MFIGFMVFVVGVIAFSFQYFFGMVTKEPISSILVGLVVFVPSCVLSIIQIKRMSSDTELDIQVQDQVNQLKKTALGKHGVTEEQVQEASPLVLGGYILEEKIVAKLFAKKYGGGVGVSTVSTMQGAVTTVISPAVALGSVMSASAIANSDISIIKHKKGRDGIIRSAIAEYTIFFFSEDKVLVYTQQFSLIDPSKTKESSRGYFYRDIVSASLETSKYGAHAFTVKISGGDTLIIPCSNAKADGIKEGVTAFMQLVRDKKKQ
jgi:hypothetical protein